MPVTFYPHADDNTGSLMDRIDLLMEYAQRYKAVVLDTAAKPVEPGKEAKRMAPKDQGIVYNWELLARVLRESREQPEANKADRVAKADCLSKLAEVYEVLRAARMSKLEAVRIALTTEGSHLRGGDAAGVTSGASRVA